MIGKDFPGNGDDKESTILNTQNFAMSKQTSREIKKQTNWKKIAPKNMSEKLILLRTPKEKKHEQFKCVKYI